MPPRLRGQAICWLAALALATPGSASAALVQTRDEDPRTDIGVAQAGIRTLEAQCQLVEGAQGAGSPQEVVDRAKAGLRVPDFRARVRLTRLESPTRSADRKQLRVVGRSADGRTSVAYQVVAPASSAGPALVLDWLNGRSTGGFLLEAPGRVRSVTEEMLDEPFFGSDFRVADLAASFFDWPSAKVDGDETLLKRPCAVLLLRPAPASRLGVRAWFAVDISLPLRLEWLVGGDHIERRIVVERVRKVAEGRWWAQIVTASDLRGGGGTSRLEGTQFDGEATVRAEELEPAFLQRLFGTTRQR